MRLENFWDKRQENYIALLSGAIDEAEFVGYTFKFNYAEIVLLGFRWALMYDDKP